MQRVNRACLTSVASKWQGAPSRSGVSTNGSHHDLICACGRDLLLRCQMLLEILAILHVHHGLGPHLFGGGVGDLGGRCRAGGRACGMWKEEEDGGRVWITCLDRRGRSA